MQVHENLTRATPLSSEAWSRWAPALLSIALTAVCVGALNWDIIVAAVRVWIVSPTYSHCFFIVPVTCYLIYQKRHIVSTLAPHPLPLAAVLAIPFMAAQIVGSVLGIHEIQQFSFIAILLVAILSCVGWEVFRTIMFPLLYLFFLVPTGEYLIPPLQAFTTRFISSGLTTFGILHFTEGTVIYLANGAFRVAEACAGLRFLIATVAVGTLFAYFQFHRWYKSAFIFGSLHRRPDYC